MVQATMSRPSSESSPIGPDLVPFAPVIWLAWSDGSLTPDEILALRERLIAAGVDARTRTLVEEWLDPDAPPSSAALERLLEASREAAGSTANRPHADLASLGEALATPGSSAARSVRRALEGVGDSLGVVDSEATRAILPDRAAPPAEPVAAAFDVAAMHGFLDAYQSDLRESLLERLAAPEFEAVPHHDFAAYRQRVLEWCRLLAADGYGAIAFPHEFGGEHDAARAIVAFETIAYHDTSLLVKFGVQFGLFGGSIWLLGTRRHHEQWLASVGTLDLPGCFAMTETAHGSNVRDIETTATWVPETREFEIHTPNRGAMKDYIGNAALHGRMATVFAQLITGDEKHGVHAILVPIRDDDGNPLDGITIEDCGAKEGLNGIDNGRIAFDRVRVPRENLLNRFGDVAEDGSYHSPIPGAGRRFFTMIGTLVAGRVAIAAASLSTSKVALTIAVRYAARRRQFGPEGRPEIPILDYRIVQHALLPRVATAYVLDTAITDLIRRFAERSENDAQEVEALAAGLKAWASRFAVGTMQVTREACGGQGYLGVNRIASLRADTDVFTTFEGANDVLLQLVARSRLTNYRERFGDLKLWNVVRWIGGRAVRSIAERNPVATRRAGTEHLRDPDFHLAAFSYREERLLASLANRLRARIGDGTDSFDALNQCQDHAIDAALAFIERHILERARAAIADAAPGLTATLDRLSALFALTAVQRDAAWYLAKGYLEAGKTEAIRDEIAAICAELRPDAVRLVDAFGIPDALLPPIARTDD
jgi:acyl-CoA oxidase